ncbi:MAG: M23 family metallopeptidase [Gemmatimonadaceae bacterium]
MSSRRARAIAYGVVAVLAVAAIVFTKPLPSAAIPPAGEVLAQGEPVERWNERHDTVARGETLVGVLARGGLSELIAREAITAAKMLDPRRIPAGMAVRVRSMEQDTIPSEIVLELAVDRLVYLKRTGAAWIGEEVQLPWTVDTIVIAGTIKSSLYAAMDEVASDVLPERARWDLVNRIAEDIFEYRVDMSRDLRVGDEFRVVTERSVGPQGITRMGTVLAATMTLSGKTTEAVRFNSAKVDGLYFDQDGKPMRSGFLRSPVQFRRISSRFGMRRHPILGTMRKHAGTDYAANAGTPIRAIGEGLVIRAGWHNGYGNVIDIRHGNGYVSRYGHMRAFAKGISSGVRVSREQTIGYVGSTGLSTAPHLHFEVLVKGVQRNPASVLANVSADPIPPSEREAFAVTRTQALAMLASQRYLASAEPPRSVSAQ